MMRCPKCKAELVEGGMQRYETMSEHVTDPNKKEYPLRPTWVCPNTCQGEAYFDPDGYGYRLPLGARLDVKGGWTAIDSTARKIEMKILHEKEKRNGHRS